MALEKSRRNASRLRSSRSSPVKILLEVDRCFRDDELHSREWWKKFQSGSALSYFRNEEHTFVGVLAVGTPLHPKRRAGCNVIKIKCIIYALSSIVRAFPML